MKVVLRHNATGRYYRAPYEWVRRADNALAFDDVTAAQKFLQLHQLKDALPVYRFAPFLMSLLQNACETNLPAWTEAERARWLEQRSSRFNRN